MENHLISNQIQENLNFDGVFLLDMDLPLKPSYNFVHSHNIYEIGIVASGIGVFIVNDKVYTYSTGDITIAAPGDMHISNSSDNQKSIWHYINIDLNKLAAENSDVFLEISNYIMKNPIVSGVYPQRKYPHIHQLINLLFRELAEERYASTEMRFHLLASLIIELCRISGQKSQRVPVDMEKYKLIAPALSYITLNYSTNITAKTLADACFISETHLRRLFKEVLNISPLNYLYKTRVAASKSLLKTTGLSVLEISQIVGYQTLTSFNSHFKRFTNTTPMMYRKNNLQ